MPDSGQRRRFQARQCTSETCRLRFPVDEGSPLGERCPKCRAPTTPTGPAYVTHPAPSSASPPLVLEVLIDNVRSLRNVGSMFRTADGAGIAHLHLGGFTPTPDHPKLDKTALGAQARVGWTHHPDAAAAAQRLRDEGAELWALEGGPQSRSLFDPAFRAAPPSRCVLVVGHEVSGVDPRILERCHRVVHIPMLGVKDSLNVSVALGIAAYTLRFGG